MYITGKDITNSVKELGVEDGDIILVHSSLKSFGLVEGGAEQVIQGLLEAVGSRGTLVMPTLIQKDFSNAYKTWYMDKPSEVGYITEVFRKMQGTLRSDHATHSVAARGRLAERITEGHTSSGPRRGPFGDYAMSCSSPWQKLYDLHAKAVFLGVSMDSNTSKHVAEYKVMERLAKKRPEFISKIQEFSTNPKGLWPYANGEKLRSFFEQEGLVKKAICGNATLLCIPVHETVNLTEKLIQTVPEEILYDHWAVDELLEFLKQPENPPGSVCI